jgi:hypothetical protein
MRRRKRQTTNDKTDKIAGRKEGRELIFCRIISIFYCL